MVHIHTGHFQGVRPYYSRAFKSHHEDHQYPGVSPEYPFRNTTRRRAKTNVWKYGVQRWAKFYLTDAVSRDGCSCRAPGIALRSTNPGRITRQHRHAAGTHTSPQAVLAGKCHEIRTHCCNRVRCPCPRRYLDPRVEFAYVQPYRPYRYHRIAENLLSMGPDPGGHTRATVTPETTRTGQPAADSARAAASGGKTESSGPSVTSSEKSKK